VREQHLLVTPASNSNYKSGSRRGGYSLESRIYHVIDEAKVELKPWEIAKKVYAPCKPTANQKSAVRVLCRKLLGRGLIVQPYDGAYCNKITYGVRFVPVLVHNLRLRCKVSVDLVSDEVVEWVGGVKVRVVFGSERCLVSGVISCDEGMSRDACFFAVDRWFAIVRGVLGFDLVEVEVTSFEVNRDFVGTRIDGGLGCVTRQGLCDFIERTYQKSENVVRAERKFCQVLPVHKFEEAFDDGFVGLGGAQEFRRLYDRVLGVEGAVKGYNGRLLQVERFVEAVCKSQLVLVDRVVALELGVVALKDGFVNLSSTVSKLVELLSGLSNAALGSELQSVHSDDCNVNGGKIEYVV